MSPEDFDPDLIGFAVSLIGMMVCVAGAGFGACNQPVPPVVTPH